MSINNISSSYVFWPEIEDTPLYATLFTAVVAVVGIVALKIFCAAARQRHVPQIPTLTYAPIPPEPVLTPLEKQWHRLESRTKRNASIPELHSYPHQKELYPHCTWVKQDLPAHWIGRGLTDRKMIALPFPKLEEFRKHWEMFSEFQYLIIDLTNEDDRSRLKDESHTPFYPVEKVPLVFKNFRVTYEGMKENGRHVYQIGDKQIERLNYNSWPDGDVISIQELDKLVNICLLHPEGVFIHCLGGLGRTGTLSTASILKEWIQNNQITRETFNPSSLSNFTYDIRLQRSKKFVHTYEQFELLFQYGSWLLGQE